VRLKRLPIMCANSPQMKQALQTAALSISSTSAQGAARGGFLPCGAFAKMDRPIWIKQSACGSPR
jgi:hypothetical protein